MSPLLRTRLMAALLLVPLVALATATSVTGLRCRIAGVVLSACCCGESDGAGTPGSSGSTVSEAGCCDRVVRTVASAPAELNGTARALSIEPGAVLSVAVGGLFADAFVPTSRAARPETTVLFRPPTLRLRLLAKSAFLI